MNCFYYFCRNLTSAAMVKSMTGFGKGEAALQNKKITVEIRSLNSKQLDLGLRLPAVYRQSEYEIRNIIARTIQRGKVDVFVTVESQAVETPARINKEVFREYLHQMTDTLAFAGIDADYDAIVPVIMRLPEVISTETESISDEEHAALIAATEAAAARLDAFRMQEGAILIADLLGRVDRIESYKEEVVPFEKARTETIKARILDNLEKLQADVDRNRLEQEMIFYLEKLDITEEKVRLANHCRYFREVAAGEEGAGRKLGFIAQEMGREINTMGSKANESNIQILVVKMKDELEKIKEQVLNIL
ncbi:TIGR00255 family protein [Alistipes sp. HGB5]|nr:TIGR00255 family protein [Alistipes sp. HGB5]